MMALVVLELLIKVLMVEATEAATLVPLAAVAVQAATVVLVVLDWVASVVLGVLVYQTT